MRDKDGNYLSTNLNLLRFNSVPLADFDHLWKDKSVQKPASVRLHTDRWEIGFEIIYRETELAAIRPTKDVSEDALGKYRAAPLIPVYIPPLSGLDVKEPRYDPVVLLARSARAQAGSVLRNMVFAVSQDAQKWQKLQEVIKSFFGYELSPPSGGAEILARYRHSAQDTYYDLSSAGRRLFTGLVGVRLPAAQKCICLTLSTSQMPICISYCRTKYINPYTIMPDKVALN